VLEKQIIQSDQIPRSVVSSLERRDVALWIGALPQDLNRQTLLRFLGLPWKLVLSEAYDAALFADLQSASSIDDPLTRRRGYIQLIDSDPARIELPDRSLPVYLIGGRSSAPGQSEFADQLRRMTMLDSLSRSAPRELLILAGAGDPIPKDFQLIWNSGFRCNVTVVSAEPDSRLILQGWVDASDGFAAATLVRLSPAAASAQIVEEYDSIYPEERHVIRLRDVRGELHKVDVTTLDEPERPVLGNYSLIEERDLRVLTPEELGRDDFMGFFRDPTYSWRPYAAGLPWIRNPDIEKDLLRFLRRIDITGPDENVVTFIASQSGAGGTTLARALAWKCAELGYPTLVAKPAPFVPDALQVRNFLSRVRARAESDLNSRSASPEEADGAADPPRRYETPWLIVFDVLHSQSHEDVLTKFRNDLRKSGRPCCVLAVTGPNPIGLLSNKVPMLGELKHQIEMQEAQDLGVHLNRFLRVHGIERTVLEWESFYSAHTVRWVEGVAAFWIALSFWIQGQFDISESIQEWIYRCFKQNVDNPEVQLAIAQIAALSSERAPMPEALLAKSNNKWPISQLLSDLQTSLAALGLVRIERDSDKYWSLVHDILGRLFVNALFYDYPLREQLGFSDAASAEHLRFMLLRQVSLQPALGEVAYRKVGEDFATTIFKIDPTQGRVSFATFWRQVLQALDEMPRGLRDGSRLFRHHCAISRRRVGFLDQFVYGVSVQDRVDLLRKAIDDLRYALEFIEYTPGAESNLNLYNSLANAYFDLARAEAAAGATKERLVELRGLGNDATRRAYTEDPSNSFTIETYVKNLIQNAQIDPEHAVELCVEGLGILFSALSTNEAGYRAMQLGTHADSLLKILFEHTPQDIDRAEPRNAVEVLTHAWRALASSPGIPDAGVIDFSQEARQKALDCLQHPAGRGNMLVMRLTYDLLCAQEPHAFDRQVDLLQQLNATNYRLPAQLKLEYAILLFQNSRYAEGDREFRNLRNLWRESEQLVYVPERLRWLRGPDHESLKPVSATVGPDSVFRPFAKVGDLGNISAPFRSEEFGLREPRGGTRFTAYVTFGHNGPFLRPTTAGPQLPQRGSRG
jgi:hypothetical protein